jgi:hypothetical protein
MARIYKEDIQAAKNLSEILPVEVVTNIFQFNKNQANMLKAKVEISSVNNRTNKLLDGRRKSKVVVTPRMVEVAATLNYMGFSQAEVANIFECDTTTIFKRLQNYPGYKAWFRIS